MKQRGLYYQNSYLGTLGECTGIYPLCGSISTFSTRNTIKVGDVVSFYVHGQIYAKIVTKNKLKNSYGVYGFGSDNFDFELLTKVLDHKDLTEDIVRKFIGGKGKEDFSIRDIEKREMTIEEIEKELGYEIKIVGAES